MTKLTVTAKGQVTLRKDVLKHLGIMPGDKIEADMQPDGKVLLQSERKTGSLENFFGSLEGYYDGPPLTIDQINEAIEKGWAGEP
ncbi:AbrB/MazE/SpoVT family DNA-binding domain-containing protein [Aurantimonas sp. A3-2-R12]|uniref:AbrB/MazE/SpoVT family DNA-binding domain-containing protein n=1 Tax=Aurantimonas sp. A3-2-R12 TaxID=3114362 RepID=UPI002E188800|nr:AbrB/MazE/SpoVT family DNA-binding domain-containing protein [Aurantimonas sp. A3-2-R12]